MTRETKQVHIAFGALVLLATLVCGVVLAQSKVLLATAILAQIDVPHSAWLARCSALPISALDGIEIIKATVRPTRVSALLRKGDRMGWLSCNKIGVYSGVPVFACYGPTVLRDRMAADPNCTHAIAWSAVAGLPVAVRDWVKARSTCCGESSLGPAWPCGMPGVTVTRLDGIGPGVVGAEHPCGE